MCVIEGGALCKSVLNIGKRYALNTLWIIFCTILFVSCNLEKEESHIKIEGFYEFNELINEPYSSPVSQKSNWTKTLDSLNLTVLEEYIEAELNFALTSTTFGSETYEKLSDNLDTILSQDVYLNSLPERVLFSFYNLYFVNQHDLLFNPCIVNINPNLLNGTSAIYMTEEQFDKLRPDLGKKQSLTVELVECVEKTQFTIYKLVEV